MKSFFKGRLGMLILITIVTILPNYAQTDSAGASHRINQDTSILKKMGTEVSNVVVDLFEFAKPARSFWQILGLMVFVSLIRP